MLIVNGSGPLDRNSNMPDQSLEVAPAVAAMLAERGVASLRYDKRGGGESDGDYLITGFHQETNDASDALAALCDLPGIDPARVAVLGHSVGASIAIRLAATHAELAGAVLLCAAAHNGFDVMEWQSHRIAASLPVPNWLIGARFTRRQRRARQALASSTGDTIELRGDPYPARWYREYMAYDPMDDLAQIKCPVLAITGEKDIQVNSDDIDRIGATVGGPFNDLTPQNLTHLLRIDTGPASLTSYRDQFNRPVDPDLLATIGAWVTSQVNLGRGPLGKTEKPSTR